MRAPLPLGSVMKPSNFSVLAPPGVPGNVSHRSKAQAATKMTPNDQRAILTRRFAVIVEVPLHESRHDDLSRPQMKGAWPGREQRRSARNLTLGQRGPGQV